jgi:hypothetical protein
MASSLLCTLPWLPLMLLTGSLPGFIIFFALASEYIPRYRCPDDCLVLARMATDDVMFRPILELRNGSGGVGDHHGGKSHCGSELIACSRTKLIGCRRE